MHRLAGALAAIAAVPQVILDVATADERVRIGIVEFAKIVSAPLLNDIGEDIQAAAMGHAKHDLAHAGRASALDNKID